MSFSQDTREELSYIMGKHYHCRLAELAAVVSACGSYSVRNDGRVFLVLQSESLPVIRKAGLLIHSLTRQVPDVSVSGSSTWKKSRIYTLAIRDQGAAVLLLGGMGLLRDQGALRDLELPPDYALLQEECCRRAFVRGAFLSGGAISDPNSVYHFELIARSEDKAVQLQEILHSLNIHAKIMVRKSYPVIYVKDSDEISDLLNMIGADRSCLEFENIRVRRGISGDVNRKVNCETANLNKTVTAGNAQIQDILKIQKADGLHSLPQPLLEVAMLRLDNPDASLQEIGEMLTPPVGKSGINHRFRKIKALAKDLPD